MGHIHVEVVSQEVKPVYGWQRVVITQDIAHTVESKGFAVTNYYTVSSSLRFLDGFNVELEFDNVVMFPEDTNEETLTEEALLQMLNDEVGNY